MRNSPARRVIRGMRRQTNWLQLVRFGLVGAVGFLVNLAVYTLLFGVLGSSITLLPRSHGLWRWPTNFVLNRQWTFHVRDLLRWAMHGSVGAATIRGRGDRSGR